ncbi:MAG TPA: DUF2442 domain-containing protein [Candidatus Sumerlaeota bacterium]|nr:MAG: hypothetical protein BWY12_00797 [candidate division BRC1 bacterium ADurb.Bin183]HOE63185.1 DUF2442 domain-containing protein [Candidatus Sumerlaeota bacterium]HRR31544.1 DUF2442 domain-containing protein [Candidatus Sumerlaeia bacterium]HON50543.1 DUF2442 domain-containing protein [Candidatus Sumerlaeota bacterium]HOR65365.1 DUF2442 domain-containing protein [Candidatus Sumerlaeota bacterium]
MKKSLSVRGKNTFQSEVTNIGAFGFWLMVEEQEYFVPFDDYPMFKKASVEQVFSFQQISPTQFHWHELDVDIELEALKEPNRFPLIFTK